jgi:hypothetical protein
MARSKTSWCEHLYLEECSVGFDVVRCEGHGFRFTCEAGALHPASYKVQLDGMGPKLLVSDASTRDQKLLRWKLCVRGNTAVEFGVVPVQLQVRRARERARQQGPWSRGLRWADPAASWQPGGCSGRCPRRRGRSQPARFRGPGIGGGGDEVSPPAARHHVRKHASSSSY